MSATKTTTIILSLLKAESVCFVTIYGELYISTTNDDIQKQGAFSFVMLVVAIFEKKSNWKLSQKVTFLRMIFPPFLPHKHTHTFCIFKFSLFKKCCFGRIMCPLMVIKNPKKKTWINITPQPLLNNRTQCCCFLMTSFKQYG